MTPLLTLEQVSVHYQNVIALNNINLTLPTKRRIAIIGPNGAGKSTLLQACLGLIPMKSGEIKLFGESVTAGKKRVAYVPQRSNVNWYFPTTVLDVILMGITSHHLGFKRVSVAEKEFAQNALEKMQLADLQHRQINQLSGGQKQRVFLARAIAQNADAYFLDEPLAGVDKTSETLIMDQLELFQKQGKSSITVHHQLDTLKEYFDYIVLVNRQIIVAGEINQTLTQENIHLTYMGSSKLIGVD